MIDIPLHEYEIFTMKEEQNIDEIFKRFSNTINTLDALRKVCTDRELVRKSKKFYQRMAIKSGCNPRRT